LVLLNDTVDYGAKDSQIGQRILDAVRAYPARDRDRGRLDIFARPDAGGGASYGSVISQAHADYSQIVVVGRNYGRPLHECADLDWYAVDQLKTALEKNGYRVTKRRKPKEAA
jgi:hypothetical protein